MNVFLLFSLSFFSFIQCKYIPTLIWTSQKFQSRRNVEDLVLNKIQSELFESYISEVLGDKSPLIVVFLEQTLSPDDFEWKENENAFPFLSNLSVKSRVDYFRAVESPHQSVLQLCKKGYKSKHIQPDSKLNETGSFLLLVEFEIITNNRTESLKSHDEIMESVNQHLESSNKDWICMYTARDTKKRERPADFKQLSSWHVEEQNLEKFSKVVSLYQDVSTGVTLMTKGSIELHLPSTESLAVKSLDNYLGVSAKEGRDNMDFVIWFPNYTMTMYLYKEFGEWLIRAVKVENENGDSLNLTKREELLPENKCYFKIYEFKSQGKPIVKMKLLKYKFMRLELQEESCENPFHLEITSSTFFFSTITAAFFWHVLQNSCCTNSKSKILTVPLGSIFEATE